MFPGKPERRGPGRERRGQSAEGRSSRRARAFLCLLPSAICALILTACDQKMANQPRYDPLEASDFFADGMAARPRVDGTVARGELSANPFFDTGKINGQLANGFPAPVTRQLIDRGHERFDIYCSECHGRVGDGNGMIPARGFRRPPSFHTQAQRAATTGHLFDVMTNGFGSMPPYRTMIPTQDRWAIVAYIKALQLSQNATSADIPPNELAKLAQPERLSPLSPQAGRGAGGEGRETQHGEGRGTPQGEGQAQKPEGGAH